MTELLSRTQKLWLQTRGGRTINDVIVKDNMFFVEMRSRGQDVLVRIPETKNSKIWVENGHARSEFSRRKYRLEKILTVEEWNKRNLTVEEWHKRNRKIIKP